MNEIFNEDLFFTYYKKIKSNYKKYYPYDILFGCINFLHRPTKDDIEELQKEPWLIFLLIKWVFTDDQYSNYNKKPLSLSEFYKIIQMMKDLGGKIRMPTEYSHHTLFFRNLAYQQFIYQLNFNIASIGRQLILFNSNDNDDYQKLFYNISGLDILTFLELAIYLIAIILNPKNNQISIDSFKNIETHYNQTTIYNFLDLFSVRIDELRNQLLASSKSKRKIYEYYEQTSIIYYPFILANDRYICLHKKLLHRKIEHCIYDTLKNHNASKFMDYFGNTFEKYIHKGLDYIKLNFLTEKILISKYKFQGKIVDFLITETTANIFIDAKAVEMAYLGKVTYDPLIVSDKINNSIIKAIEQALNTNKNIHNLNIKFKSYNNYLLVITYKELYLGNGVNFYESIAKERIDKIFNEFKTEHIIPLENMYFITIYEFEYLIEIINRKKYSLSFILDYARVSDKNSSTMKFDFIQHLSSLEEKLFIPKYLDELNNNLIDNFHEKISK
jgi:hypothetical protein